MSIIGRNDPAIADGNFMCVAPQVFNNLLWAIKGLFTMDDPGFFKELFRQVFVQRYFVSQRCYIACPEDSFHFLYGEQVFAFCSGGFPFIGFGDAPCRDDAMQVGVQAHVLSPGMKHGDHAHFGPQ
jgi:hypothetical protein